MPRLLRAPARMVEFWRLPLWSMMRVQAEIRASTSRPLQSRQSELPRAMAGEAPATSSKAMAERREVELNLYILAAPAGCQLRVKASTSGQLRFDGNKVLL